MAQPKPLTPLREEGLIGHNMLVAGGTILAGGLGFAFQVVGAPWLDTAAVLRRVRDGSRGTAAGLAGVELTATRFTPRAPTLNP